MAKTPKMTAMEAVTFEHESPMNMMMFYEWQEARNQSIFSTLDESDIATSMESIDANLCECEPYQDVFTYNRWKAQGYQVRRGEHGCRVTTWVPKDKDNPDKGVFPRTATVFCRCQVDKI